MCVFRRPGDVGVAGDVYCDAAARVVIGAAKKGRINQVCTGAENGLTDAFRVLIADLAADLRHVDDRIGSLDERIGKL